PAQVTRLGTLGTGFDQCLSLLASLGRVTPREPEPGPRAARLPPAGHRPSDVKGGCMRTIGLDLAVQTAHKAVVLDETGHFCTPILTIHTRPSELDQLLVRACDGTPSTEV